MPPEYRHDPELDTLVRELNLSRAAAIAEEVEVSGAAWTGRPRRSLVSAEGPLSPFLMEMLARRASDLLLVPGSPPTLRLDGRLLGLAAEALSQTFLAEAFAPHLDRRLRDRLEAEGSCDFSLSAAALASDGSATTARFRVNLHRQRGHLAAALRALPGVVPTLAQLNLPASLAELVERQRGLVLLCGPAGAGKSSTLAALVAEINRGRSCHILTIEDPIEYEHKNQRSLIEQIEVGTDASSFAAALKAALRQAPDVILVGEMRDLDTISVALTAAETGHLVLSTLHTHDSAQAIHRLVDVFPAEQQGQIRQQLALALSAIVCQQLVPRVDRAGRVPALEVLHATYGVRHHIRQNSMQKLQHEITLGKRSGMFSLEESLARLVLSGVIAREEAEMRATRPEELASLLKDKQVLL